MQELQWQDVVMDVLAAVQSLGKQAREADVVSRAVELGVWSTEELEARAWYTGNGIDSHIEHIVRRALQVETGSRGTLERLHGVYVVRDSAPDGGFGVPYHRAAANELAAAELPTHQVDLTELDRATKRHMDLQDRLADMLRGLGVEPRSPASWQPQFDLAFEYAGKRFVIEIKSGDPVSAQQVRLGVGQVLEYGHLLRDIDSQDVRAVLLIEAEPPHPWRALGAAIGIQFLQADQLENSLSSLFSGAS